MNDETFRKIASTIAENPLSVTQRRALTRHFAGEPPKADNVTLVALVGVAFFFMIYLNPLKISDAADWMVYASTLMTLASFLAYLMWYLGRDMLNARSLGFWLWSTAMLLLAFNFCAMIVFATECVNLTDAIGDGGRLFSLEQESCRNGSHAEILKFFLTAKEFGALIAVVIGLASVAWVSFFSRSAATGE